MPISYGNEEVTFADGKTHQIGVIRQVNFDRDNNKGEVKIRNGAVCQTYSITLSEAYTLIVYLGTKSWVNL